MTNTEVFSAFANGQAAQGGSTHSQKLLNGAVVLYSYGTPIAYKCGHSGGSEALAVFDSRKYSVTTTKQQTQAKAACGHYEELAHEEFRQACRYIGVDLSLAR